MQRSLRQRMLVAVAALAEHHAILLAGIGLGGSFLLIALYAVYVSQRVVRPMTEAIQTERKVLEPDRYVETMERLRVHPEQPSADEFELYGGRSFVGREVTQERELDRLKDEFVATVSHELRTPLTSLMGFLEMVRNGEAGELTPEQERFLAIVSRSSERLRRLVGDLLFVARLDAGGSSSTWRTACRSTRSSRKRSRRRAPTHARTTSPSGSSGTARSPCAATASAWSSSSATCSRTRSSSRRRAAASPPVSSRRTGAA
jgi:signal transduction histidine kinase